MSYVQAGRHIAIETPLGENALLLKALTGVESISRLFHFELDLYSEDAGIVFEDIVGQNVTLTLLEADGGERYWNGQVSRFAQSSRDGSLTSYHATVVPWLWFLTRTADCRIFQKKKVPQIIEQVFDDLGFSDFEFRLYGDFVERDYCVQYRETDFNFVSRLMEEEGICYFFDHARGKHTLVLTNEPDGHRDCPGQAQVRFLSARGGSRAEYTVSDFRPEHEFQPESCSMADYNFETAGTGLGVSVPGREKYDVYDFPGEYLARSEGESLARIRLQEQASVGLVIRGGGHCRQFTSGYTFSLSEHYRRDLNTKYLITSVRHSASQSYESGDGGSGGELAYENTFDCIPHSVPFRPQRVTPQPFVQGCQTAVVVGPSGEEIYTDEHGRVKVQFHWDREGERNENSSCWVRVSHPWAGKSWGALSIPRIGQEVVVDFLEGNPDQPIILGRVYNSDNMPPFGLPDGAVISGIKSDSTKGGGGYNQISMDDSKGNELVHIHAQYDMDTKVENDERVNVGSNRTESVGADESITIGSNRTEKVGADETITIGANRAETVGTNETINIGSNRTESVGGNESITVAATRTRNVGVNEMVNVGAAQEITIGGLQAVTVGAVRTKNVGAAENVSIGAGQTVDVGADQTVSVGGAQSMSVAKARSTSVGEADTLQVGKTLSVDAADSIVLKTGKASITMKKDGTITIQGKDITIKGSGAIDIKASKDIVMKGKKILEN